MKLHTSPDDDSAVADRLAELTPEHQRMYREAVTIQEWAGMLATMLLERGDRIDGPKRIRDCQWDTLIQAWYELESAYHTVVNGPAKFVDPYLCTEACCARSLEVMQYIDFDPDRPRQRAEAREHVRQGIEEGWYELV